MNWQLYHHCRPLQGTDSEHVFRWLKPTAMNWRLYHHIRPFEGTDSNVYRLAKADGNELAIQSLPSLSRDGL